MNIIKDLIHIIKILQSDGISGLTRVIKRRVIRFLGGSIWDGYRDEALFLSKIYDYSEQDLNLSMKIHETHKGAIDIQKVTWFIPDFFNPYYGGIFTILRFANFLKSVHGIEQEFAVIGSLPEEKISDLIGTAYPLLKDATVHRLSGLSDFSVLGPTDAAVATLWSTAYALLKFNQTKRKFYFIQDLESLFYPAGTIQAQVESTYRFGFYGLTNTPTLKFIYENEYSGKAEFFYPCVDTNIFYPVNSRHNSQGPYRLFFYGRPDHPRNGFEMGIEVLRKLKSKMGEEVEIIAAGAKWNPADYSLNGIVKNLGVLNLKETSELYRTCDAGLVLMFTRHPSYIPFELMASGSLVITNWNPFTTWFLKDGINCLLAIPGVTNLAEKLEYGLRNSKLREAIVNTALKQISESFSDWSLEFEKIYQFMKSPK